MRIGDEQLERLTEWVSRLLAGDDAEVTWSDHIPDPDNPRQCREIDVTIRRGDSLTYVECRSRSRKEDVTWIELLMGRRDSLQADIVIAVSASGFTQGAIRKAAAKGIILRTVDDLSDEEIREWGKSIRVTVDWIRFQRLNISFRFDIAAKAVVTRQAALELLQNSCILKNIIQSIKERVQRDLEPGESDEGILRASTQQTIHGHHIKGLTAEFSIEVATEVASLPIVRSYNNQGRLEASVATNDAQSIHIARSGTDISVIIDISTLRPESNCVLQYVNISPEQLTTLAHVQLIGQECIPECKYAVKLNLEFDEAEPC